MTYDTLISPPASSISPAVSLAKTDSTLSFYNEYLVDDPSNERFLKEETRVQPYLANGGIDSHIWFPPEPEDKEDDIEGSVANFDDDDDDDDDGMKWGKPSNLSTFGHQGSGSFRFREETRKTLNEVMNGKFKALVEHLLKSMSIDSDNWVGTVTALSWEAASFLKPDSIEGKTMDPDGYVKVKCIATGTRSQSEVFKGLVFKKHAAHKHMPTKCKKPKLLLIKGALSVSSDGLSSFESMKQEADRVNNLIGMIEKLNPNVVLVEKTVSRDIQESIFSKGMTLVLEMKEHRLERVARCTGSPILSSDNLSEQKLKQCESLYFEKIVEEHADLSEGGKKPKKTLMFLEGCPTRMGFTILLKGCHNDELKKVKCVVQFAVIMAYHLILESSFILNQRVMFSTTAPNGMTIFSNNDEETNLDDTNVSIVNESTPETDSVTTIDIPISTHFEQNGADNLGLEGSTLSSYEEYDPIVISGLSSLSASLHKVVGVPLYDTMGYNDLKIHNHSESNGQDLISTETIDVSDVEVKVGPDENLEHCKDGVQRKDDIRAVLDSESILVLMSRRNVTRGTTCKQSSFSCIKFYRNFDVPLGKFLRDNLLNQRLSCGTCNELPEAHLHYYAHHDKQLTIQVKRLPSDKHLAGENEGKLWMWSCCGQCKPVNGSLKSTKRVLVSIAARGLSFGKFLELGFSNHSSWEIPSTCGHRYYKDYLHFFGLGSMVAMFRYSTVATYSVSLPLWKVEFSKRMEGDYLKEEVEDVFQEGYSMFTEVEKSLKKLENESFGSGKRFSDIKEMLKQERDKFQGDMKTLTSVNSWLQKPLYLNHIRWELFLHSYIWDERLHSILSSDHGTIGPRITDESGKKPSSFEEKDNTAVEINIGSVSADASYQKTDIPEESDDIPSEVITTEINIESSNSVQENGVQETDESSSTSTQLSDPKGWMWTSFSQIQNIHLSEYQKGYLPKYEPINTYASGSTLYKIITEQGSKIHFPLATNNHIVSVYEDELSSLIACALAYLKDGMIASDDITDDTSFENTHKLSSLTSPNWSSFTSTNSDSSSFGSSSEESRFSSFDGLEILDSVANSWYIHPVVSMGRYDKKAKYSVACLFAKDFLDLRGQCGLSELDYISSLSRCKHWDAKGGKSKSFFAKTLDDRFIIKEIKNTEFCSFLGFASEYFGYMTQCFKQGNQTCLAKILGIYQVKKIKTGVKHDLMVMENITYCRKITRQYDLKGALYSRYNASVDGGGDVLLDQNFVNDMNVSPLYVNTKAKRNLQRAVWNDTAFLYSINVMDYSLLVGVDVEQKELVCGIIDYVRQYTWDKQLENWVKSFVVPKNQLPTIISPKEYKKRFRKFIDTHLFAVPDDWCSQRSSNRCSLCGVGPVSKSQVHEELS